MTPVVDAQVHVWPPESPGRPWPEGGREWREAGHRRERVDAEVLLREMSAAGVHRAVLVPPLFEGYRNDYALATARAHPDRFRVMARVDLERADLPDALDRVVAQPLAAGVRLVFLPGDAGCVTSEAAQRFWPLAQRRNLPVMVHVPGQLAALADVARRYPDLRLAVDHLGLSGQHTDAAVAAEIAPLLDLARFPNVAVKLSALPCYSTEPCPHPALHEPVRRVITAFGPHRVFWGSDLSRLRGGYRDAITMIGHLGLDAADTTAVLGASLLQWLPWAERTPAR